MATLVLSAVGASLGSGFGTAALGLSGAVLGRAAGATIGRAIDQRLLGQGSRAVETGRIDRLRLQTAGEGMQIPRVWGQMRLPGHVIWASPMREVKRSQSGGGKGGSQPTVSEISYVISVAIAICEGTILGVGRVWADGEEISTESINLRVYRGDNQQLPDPAVAAHEGEQAPAYRGLAYVVLENLGLERWGNRMPQFTFELTRAAQDGSGMQKDVRAVAMIPGTGEYTLATAPVTVDKGLGEVVAYNRNTPSGPTDFAVSLDILGRELPSVNSVSLVVSWFGDDLRLGHCTLRPKVENRGGDGDEMPWRAGGITRQSAMTVTRKDDRPIYGGTPTDQSVLDALQAISASGKKAVFYPFILMEQMKGNGLPDPYGGTEQPALPWRGRITTDIAAGREGSHDGLAGAVAEVETFFGDAKPDDFSINGSIISYEGKNRWGYRRFILHYAHLCALTGNVDTFLIGSEMIGLTQVRGPDGRYPAVEQLMRLAKECRQILGPEVKISYAADWSEYFGHHTTDGDVRFHLDALWADQNIDFIGIDNYMPLSDWRDGDDHLDAHWERITNVDYLASNVAAGEGYDWYYPSDADRIAQRRVPITDEQYDEPWVWRYKDLRSWWENEHYERIGGIRSQQKTAWVPGSKPFWFTEYGCAALDKGTNQPNKFLDALSSESRLPYFSNGSRNDAVQAAYIAAVNKYWSENANNPQMPDGRHMVDMSRAHVWCWDARPYPAFPSRQDLWSDGPAWERGHWLNGRAGSIALSALVSDLCLEAGVRSFDSTGLSGMVHGYTLGSADSGRAALQPLMLSYGFDVVERDGQLKFLMRGGAPKAHIDTGDMAISDEISGLEMVRAAEPELAGRVRLTHIEAGTDYGTTTAESILPDAENVAVSETEFALSLTRPEGRAITQRWLSEARIARDTARFALPPSMSHLGPGDVVTLENADSKTLRWRIDKVERAGAVNVDAVRVDSETYATLETPPEMARATVYQPPLPVWTVTLDLPLLRGDEGVYAPYIAATGTPWPGAVLAFSSDDPENGYELNTTLSRSGIMGVTETSLRYVAPGLIDRGLPLRVRLRGGDLRSVTQSTLLSGGNAMAIGNSSTGNWEIFQFASAEPVSAGIWEISHRLRGQAGTDGTMPSNWPVGSVVVLLDKAVQQVDIPPSAMGQERFWRIGPSNQRPEDASYRSLVTPIRGVGLRPYAPCHLRIDGNRLSWIRRTRLNGDGWEGTDVPLGEAREEYLVRVSDAATVIYETIVSRPFCEIPAGLLKPDGFESPTEISVAQLSEIFGAGPFVKRKI